MKLTFNNKKIDGILTVLPEQEVLFDDEVENYSFPVKQTMRLKKVMGFEKHRIVKPETASSDLCAEGLSYLLEQKIIAKEEIGAIIVATVTPDHFLPHVSTILQGKFGFDEDVLCLDISQGCAGFIVGLLESFMLLEHMGEKKVLLFNVDVLSKKVSKHDRGSYPLIGDAAAVSVISNSADELPIHLNIHMDGSRGEALMIPAGGSRIPCSAETAEVRDSGDGNLKCLDNLDMDGTAVYTFVQTDVPPLILETLEMAGVSKEAIDWYLFHQPNKFMLEKLAEQLSIPYGKVPMNIVETFGNPSGASIPVVITHNLAEELTHRRKLCCLSAFGSGLCCGAVVLNLGDFDFCDTIVSEC